ncbi:MAG: aminotransferase class I/II-fold pyridoxal phosphate-dependent enzyme, partial [Oscillospiraceae bacterium]|nr:aminotransferase class I/II-fold pyridoxal phosphate-dependent enzyme [Oscillospiraceae bacterium]
MYNLPEKLRTLAPYAPPSGDFPIRLDAKESFISVPADIKAKMLDAAGGVLFNRYPDPMAARVCESFAAYYGINPENVAAGNGSDDLISVITNAFLKKGGRLLTLSPDFSMYPFYGHIAEAKLEVMQKKACLSIDVDALMYRAGECDMLIFSNPCNPTSLGLRREDVRKIITGTNALVVLDEAYMDFWDQSLLGEINEFNNLIILRTCSKMIGLAALRLGFAVANKTLITAVKAAKSP